MISIINFSGRADGSCAVVSEILKAYYNSEKISIINICEKNISPCGECEYRCFSGEKCPHEDGVDEIYNAISSSKRSFFILPNYCGYPPSRFFVFNERGCGFFCGNQARLERYLDAPKAFLVISNTDGNNIEEALKYHISEDKRFALLTFSPEKLGVSSLEQNLATSEEVERIIAEFCSDL